MTGSMGISSKERARVYHVAMALVEYSQHRWPSSVGARDASTST